ncbi:hypothetical protein D1P53_003733 [Cryptococcus gattii VGV]|nr:hypothetical protein D1P53_003733 [Cryptococcus gattii VGV]
MSNSPFDPPAPGASTSVNRSESPAIPDCSQDVDTTDNSPKPPCYDLPVSPPIAYSRLLITRAPPNRHWPTLTNRLPNDDRGAAGLFKDEYRGAKHIGKSLLEVGLLVPAALVHWNDYSTEEEHDPEKAQKLKEMIVILRQTELKYARRCAWAFGGFSIFLIVLIVVVISWLTTR